MLLNSLKQSLTSVVAFATVLLAAPVTHASDTPTDGLYPVIMLLLEDSVDEIDMPSAARFLMQTTYGPTHDEIVALTNSSYEEWLDEQFSLPATNHIEFGQSIGFFERSLIPVRTQPRRVSVWNRVAMEAPDQLRQRMAFALSQIFVISDRAESRHSTVTQYYDLLVENAFSNYRDLLEKVTLNQDMGSFLGMAGNQKANAELNVIRPDENFAREVMQLFSIGLFELELDGTPKLDSQGQRIPTYTQATVEAFAKVFTGWHFDFIQNFTFNQNRETIYAEPNPPMKAFPIFHDTTSKTLLNVPGFNPVIPPNQTAEQELEKALDILANHPNVAPFISQQLIQRFVTSNPTPAYVRRISTVFNNTDGNLGAVLRAILLDSEARQGHIRNPEKFGKIKEPLLKATALWRGVGYLTQIPVAGPSAERLRSLEQLPLNAPSVFNFFRPEFSPSGVLANNGMLAPEAQLLTRASVVTTGAAFTNFSLLSNESQNFNNGIWNPIATDHLEEFVPDSLTRPEELVDYLDLVLLAGTMPDEMRELLLNLHSGTDGYVASNKLTVVNDILYLITLSPYYNVQR